MARSSISRGGKTSWLHAVMLQVRTLGRYVRTGRNITERNSMSHSDTIYQSRARG